MHAAICPEKAWMNSIYIKSIAEMRRTTIIQYKWQISQQASIKRSETMQHQSYIKADRYGECSYIKNPRNAHTPHHHREEEVIWAQWREQRVKRPWERRRGHPWSSDCMYSWKGNRYARTGRVSENRASSVFNEKRERERERERERNRAFWKWTYFPQSWALSHLGGQCLCVFCLIHHSCLFLCMFGGSHLVLTQLHSFRSWHNYTLLGLDTTTLI